MHSYLGFCRCLKDLSFLSQVFLLQHNENEAMSPSDLQDKIMAMLQASPDIAEAVSFPSLPITL